MAKKRLDTTSIANELERSAFFPSRQAPAVHTSPVPEPPASKPVPPEPQEPKPQHVAQNPVTPQPSKPANPQPSVHSPASFQLDLEVKADQKYTTYFTEEEHELLEDIKLDVRRRFGHKTTKQEIIRCALGELIEDYQRNGSNSRLVLRLTPPTPHDHKTK